MSTLVEKIAKALGESIYNNSSLQKLPTVSSLQRQFIASRSTILKALNILKNNGLIETRRRGGILVSGKENSSIDFCESKKKTSSEILSDYIAELILEGVIRPGQPLPKLDYYAIEKKVSRRTVQKAYEKLSLRNLAHKSSKSWIAGPSPIQFSKAKAPIILIIQPTEESWRRMYQRRFARDFANTFEQEAERSGVILQPALALETDNSHLAQALSVGKTRIGDFIRNHRDRLLGIIIIGEHQELGDITDWLQWLSGFSNIPVVWFDESISNQEQVVIPTNAVRAHRDLEAEMKLVIQSLIKAGHTKAGTVLLLNAPWPEKTFAIFCAEAAKFNSSIEIFIAKEPSLFWECRPDCRTPIQVMELLRSKGLPFIRRIIDRYILADPAIAENPELFREHPENFLPPRMSVIDDAIIWITPLLIKLIRDCEVTVLIAPDELFGIIQYYWLVAAGIDVPRQISLVSLGNDKMLHPLPISTIDPGFDYLGYAAFHFLRNDITIHPKRDRTLPTHPRLVNRGSITTPRIAPLKINLNGETGVCGEVGVCKC